MFTYFPSLSLTEDKCPKTHLLRLEADNVFLILFYPRLTPVCVWVVTAYIHPRKKSCNSLREDNRPVHAVRPGQLSPGGNLQVHSGKRWAEAEMQNAAHPYQQQHWQHAECVGLHVHAGGVAEVTLQVLEGACCSLKIILCCQNTRLGCPILWMAKTTNKGGTYFVLKICQINTKTKTWVAYSNSHQDRVAYSNTLTKTVTYSNSHQDLRRLQQLSPKLSHLHYHLVSVWIQGT